jgi:hypothetical protein
LVVPESEEKRNQLSAAPEAALLQAATAHQLPFLVMVPQRITKPNDKRTVMPPSLLRPSLQAKQREASSRSNRRI